MTPGSEFRAPKLLAPFLSAHHLWGRFQDRISEGANRLANVRANLARGNHKSVRGHEAKLIEMLKEEVGRGCWQLPLPRDAALEIKGCEVALLGMVAQTSIDKKGNPILQTQADPRPIIQPQRDVEAKRKVGHISPDGSKVQESIQPTALSHLVLTPALAGQSDFAFEGRLQVCVQTDPSEGDHSRKIMHKY